MANIYSHGKSFISRFIWLTPLMGGTFSTLKYLFEVRGKPWAFGQINYKDAKVVFRNCDSTAIKEVLVDNEYDFLSSYVRSHKDPFIIDLGAHIGTFSLWVYRENPTVNLVAIEANPETYEILKNNISNNIPKKQYNLINRAAWKNDEFIKFSCVGDSMGNKVSEDGQVKVKGITFRELISKISSDHQSINLLKIDIEGAEEAFFETADNLLSRVERLVIELHPKLCNTDNVIEKLNQYYSNIRNISGRIDSKPVLYCQNNN